LVQYYKRYHNKKVWCRERKKFVTQKVHVLSNIDLKTIPYVSLKSLQQVVETPAVLRARDLENDTLTIIIVYIDEISKVLNSRSFRTNVNASVLDSLLCCRHYHMGIMGTAQRFQHVDALFRQVTQRVIECNKTWRLQKGYVYNAYELENCTNPLQLSPISKSGFFVTNADYNAYDTIAVVGDLIKAWKDGDMLSDKDILELQGGALNVTVEEQKKKKLFGRKKSKK